MSSAALPGRTRPGSIRCNEGLGVAVSALRGVVLLTTALTGLRGATRNGASGVERGYGLAATLAHPERPVVVDVDREALELGFGENLVKVNEFLEEGIFARCSSRGWLRLETVFHRSQLTWKHGNSVS